MSRELSENLLSASQKAGFAAFMTPESGLLLQVIMQEVVIFLVLEYQLFMGALMAVS
jgi:hypothetical protein